MLEGFVISYMKIDFSSKLEFVKKFVDKIDNWSVNDSFCNSLKEFKNNRSAGYEFLEQYFNSQKEYENRFANIMLMSYYLIPEYVDRVLKVFSEFSHEAYYAKWVWHGRLQQLLPNFRIRLWNLCVTGKLTA